MFLICVSFLKRGIHTLKYKVSMREKSIQYELNLLGGVFGMALKLSLPLSMSTYLERIALYAEHVKSK